VPDLTEYAIELLKSKRYSDSANVVVTFSLQSKVNMKELLAKLKEYGFTIFDFPRFIVRLHRVILMLYSILRNLNNKEIERISLDQIIDLLENYKSMQILLIDDLISHKKYEEAWILLNYFNVSKYFPNHQSIKDKVNEPETTLKKFKETLNDKYEPMTEGGFKMCCTLEEVIFIDNDSEFDKVQGLLKAEVVGVSTEWRPAFMSFVDMKSSVLQVVSEKTFVIFDLKKLEGSSVFSELIKNLLMSMSTLKLGIGLKEDMKLVCSQYKEMTCFTHMFNYIDVADFYKEQNPHEKHCTLPNILKKLLSNVQYINRYYIVQEKAVV
jgi:DNA integrity scanning protein DisA with diadenylate cyclase activity